MNSIYEQNGGTYTQAGDYLFPNLVMDPQPEGEIGVWGWRRKMYLHPSGGLSVPKSRHGSPAGG